MKIFFIGIGVLVVVAIASIFILPKASSTAQSNDPDVVATAGMHWHPILTMYVKGEKLELPPDMGLGAVHKPMHTHAEDSAQGVIHLEFAGMVRRDDIMLGRFFEIWGKDMRSFGSNMRMTVNGKENTEYENYVMRDGDKIELRYDWDPSRTAPFSHEGQ